MEPEELTYQRLREITDAFSEKRRVGEGGFGIVYKGVTKTGEDVAVKIPRDGKDLDYSQFRNEFNNLMKVKHDNIVNFLGYCYEIKRTEIEFNGRTVLVENTHRALCFEYLHNGSLQKHLYNESCGLDWNMRYKIINGICKGLRYIHEDLKLVHLDLKPDNILLDKNMVPKIADFGLSRIFGEQLTRATQFSLGTLGYKPPEYIDKKEISKKFDIFSLGVIIIRIVSGPESYPKCLDMPSNEFIDQVQKNWRKRCQATCSGDLSHEACCHQVETCTQIALECLEKDSQKRPDIVMIVDRLNEIESDINEPSQRRRETVCGMIEWDNRQETSFDVGKEQIVGREEKRQRMSSSLEGMSEQIVILPIYGIGGIGKTTFARLICNDINFKYYSQVWVYVSSRFDLCKIGNSIISQLSGKKNQANEPQLIKICLTKLLSGKKILIVLDDLWENNTIQLVDLKDMLYFCDSIKTIVIITTRSEDIAKKMCINIEPYKIEALTDEMCLDIIKQKSGFESRRDKVKLVGIGKDIARKCGGVALAAQTLGSMLQSMEYDQWIRVRDNDIWNETISKDASLPNHVLASLKLSYTFSMDDCLKPCFTYCAIFPKGHKIVKCDLIYQWISLGFIKPTVLSSTLQLCEKYIVRLLGLTFLQHSVSQTTYRAYCEQDTFTMHDLVHDLAISIIGDKVLDQSRQGNTPGSKYNYALLGDCSQPLESCVSSPGHLRALRFLDCHDTELHGASFEPAESLRVLDLSECLIRKLPISVGVMKHLRYLSAPRIRDQVVPECITKLSNLTYLSLRGSCGIEALPESIGEIQGLVHLDLSGCFGIGQLPRSFGRLKSLEHLDFSYCKNVTGLSQYLGTLRKLQHLNLSNCKKVGKLPRALAILTELQYLNLSDSSYCWRNQGAYTLLHLKKLKYLNLSSTSHQWRTMGLPEALGGLTELEYLNLSYLIVERKLPAPFGNLCHLVHLDLSNCCNLLGVAAALDGLTKLQYLDLYSCFDGFDGMKGLQEVIGNLSELRHLNLGGCIKMKSSSNPDNITSLLGRICTLTNLEYLNLRENNNIYSIPETVGNLRKLRTLDLSRCDNLQSLPTSICKIDSLKFIYAMDCTKLDRFTLPNKYTSSSEMCGESSSYDLDFDYESDGWRTIRRLENVKSTEEVKAVKLREKTDIRALALQWTRDGKRYVDDEKVLRQLEPPYSVSKFRLEGYNGVSFPPWVMGISDYLRDLMSINMSDLPNCNNLPPLGQLPNLEELTIRGMDSLKKIDADRTRAFPRLRRFYIVDMKCLEQWNTADEDGLNEPIFRCLTHVVIRNCPRLRLKLRLQLTSFELQVHHSDEVMLSPSLETVGTASLHVEGCVVPLHQWSLLRHLRLENLTIKNCSDLTCSTLRGLIFLRKLIVEDCENIVSLLEMLGDLELTSLREVEILDCRGIKNLSNSIQQLLDLSHVVIRNCAKSLRFKLHLPPTIFQLQLDVHNCDGLMLSLDSSLQVEGCVLPLHQWSLLRHLSSLRYLTIKNCSDLTCSSPDFLRGLTCLDKLIVEGCESIVSLPERLGDLTSLTKLEILDCKGIKNLPGSLQQLHDLRYVVIRNCPRLRLKLRLPPPSFHLLQIHVHNSDQVMVSSLETVGTATSCSLQVEGCAVPLHRWSLLRYLPGLEYLTIKNCSDLTCSSPDILRGLTSLEKLYVEGCESIVSLPERLGDLTSLTRLEVRSCKAIKTLPDSIQQLTCLKILALSGCESIVSLPETLGGLASLTRLEVLSCKAITALPDSIQQLTGLHNLEISKCAKLVRWCESEENKMKLAHIKYKRIDTVSVNYDVQIKGDEAEHASIKTRRPERRGRPLISCLQ